MSVLVLSDGFAKALSDGVSPYDILSGSYFECYTGSMPSTTDANSAPTGTKLFTATLGGVSHVAETRAAMIIDMTGVTDTYTKTALCCGCHELRLPYR